MTGKGDGHGKGPLFVERRPDKQYALERGGAKRAIGLFGTQEEAIDRGHDMGEKVVAERVRNVKTGGRDQWRKT